MATPESSEALLAKHSGHYNLKPPGGHQVGKGFRSHGPAEPQKPFLSRTLEAPPRKTAPALRPSQKRLYLLGWRRNTNALLCLGCRLSEGNSVPFKRRVPAHPPPSFPTPPQSFFGSAPSNLSTSRQVGSVFFNLRSLKMCGLQVPESPSQQWCPPEEGKATFRGPQATHPRLRELPPRTAPQKSAGSVPLLPAGHRRPAPA